MAYENINQYFGKDLEAMSFAKNYHQWIIDEFSPFIHGAIAEVGAGVGNVSKLLLDTNIKSLTAFEPSNNMYSILKKTLGVDTRARSHQ